jgi:hypothetical protein
MIAFVSSKDPWSSPHGPSIISDDAMTKICPLKRILNFESMLVSIHKYDNKPHLVS